MINLRACEIKVYENRIEAYKQVDMYILVYKQYLQLLMQITQNDLHHKTTMH